MVVFYSLDDCTALPFAETGESARREMSRAWTAEGGRRHMVFVRCGRCRRIRIQGRASEWIEQIFVSTMTGFSADA